MLRHLFALFLFAAGASVVTLPAWAEGGEHRLAFVVGDGAYSDHPLPTAANDAGLMAQTLQAAGFDVVGARDLDAETFRQSYAEFLQRVTGAGPDAVAFVYLSGYGLQYGPDTYYVPVGAHVSRPADIPLQAIRLGDLLGPLEALNIKARFFVADAAYRAPFAAGAPGVTGGLALIEPAPGSLIAYNTAPDMVVAPATKDYGLYAQLLSAEMRIGGLAPDDLFERVRLRVSTASEGREIPWDASKIDANFRFFERGPDAPAVPRPRILAERVALRDLPVAEAYAAAIARDDIAGYSEFLTVYDRDPLAKRVRFLLAVRREARTWALVRRSDEPSAYWTYLLRYPKGPHAAAARARLARLGADDRPPPNFVPVRIDVPPPEVFERDIVDAGPIDLDARAYELGPPPVLEGPDRLAPLPPDLLKMPPPPEPDEAYGLPVPVFVPLPVYINPPRGIVRPRNNRFFSGDGGLHRPLPRGESGGDIDVIVVPRPEPVRRRGEDHDRADAGRGEARDRVPPRAKPDLPQTLPPDHALPGAGGQDAGRRQPEPGADRDRRRGERRDDGRPRRRDEAPSQTPDAGTSPDHRGMKPEKPEDHAPGVAVDPGERARRKERREERRDGTAPHAVPSANGGDLSPGRVEHRDLVHPGVIPPAPRPIPPAPHVERRDIERPHPMAAPMQAPRVERREMERPHPMQTPRVEHREMPRPVPAGNGAHPGGGKRFDQRP